MITIGTRDSLFSARLVGPLAEGGTRQRALFEMVKAVEEGALELENQIRGKLKGNEREFGIFTGGLFNAIQRQAATIRGDEIESIVTPGPKKHAIVINDGRGAGKRPPPVKAIELWLQRKLKWSSIATSLGKTTLSPKSTKGERAQESFTRSLSKGLAARGLRSAAFAIARAIGKRGFAEPFTRGLHYVENGTAAAAPKVQQILERGRDRYVAAWNFDNAGGLAGV